MTHIHARPAFARLLCAALAALLVTSSWPASAARGAVDSNIPGVPLPGPIVTGRLGGAIYDHVYSINVPPGRIIVLSLTGDKGPDFGLYLFDSRATTIYNTVGQVAVSNLPGSKQSIRYPSPAGGRFYIDLNGASDVQGRFQLVVTIAADTTPPRATISLDGGAPATNDPNGRVTIAASDDLSGVADMQFSTDGKTWGIWQAFASTMPWRLSAGDGRTQVWARIRDRAGNVSTVATASIVLDTTPPLVTGRSPEPDGNTAGIQPTFSVTFSEPIDVVSWLDVGLLVQDPASTVIRGIYTWDPATNTGGFRPSVALIPGALYIVTIGTVRDLAGNATPALGSWLVRALIGHVITLAVSPVVAKAPGDALVSGQIDSEAAAPLLLEESVGGGPWGAISLLSQNANNTFAVSVSVLANTAFRTHFVGSPTEAETYSPAVRVVVRRAVHVRVGSVGASAMSRIRVAIPVVATLGPALPDAAVTLFVRLYDPAKKVWREVAHVSRATVRGTATFSWRPVVRGRYLIHVTASGTLLFGSGVSSTVSWTVL